MVVNGIESHNGARAVAGGMWWPSVIVASAAIVTAATLFHAGAPVRPVAAFWFLLVCPGMAFAPLLPIRDRLIQFGFAVALSIGLDGVVSEAMLYTGAWSYQGQLAVLIGICLVGTTLQIRRVVRRTARVSAGELDRIRGFQRQGTSLLFVSHALATVAAFCKRVIVLEDSPAVYDGEPRAGLQRSHASMSRRLSGP